MVRIDICELKLKKKLRERTDINHANHAYILNDFRTKNHVKITRRNKLIIPVPPKHEKKNLKKKSSNYPQVEASLFPKIYQRGGMRKSFIC